MKLFNRPKQIQIVEVPKALPSLDQAGRKALAGLAEHPGLQYLINKVRWQRAALESSLKYGNREQTLQDMKDLQQGIKWLTWVEHQFLLAVEHPGSIEKRDLNADEIEALNQALSYIEGVGE